MRSFVIAGAAMLALAGAAQAAPRPGDAPAQAGDAATDYAAVKAEYDKAYQAYVKAYREAKSDADKAKAGELRPDPQKYSTRFREIADREPGSAVAMDCHVWVLQHDRARQEAAVAALLAHHAVDPRMASVCQSLEYSGAASADALLRAVLEKGSDREAKGRACYALARRLASREGDAAAEAEKLFETVAEAYGDLKHGRGTLADAAKGNLFELRNLAIGKVAPEIVGANENGEPMKLSDYRGKVVLLDFWGFW